MTRYQGHAGILVVTTTGSNVFLLSLYVGIIMVDASGEFGHDDVTIAELAVLSLRLLYRYLLGSL
ncbi:uncharacterized protein F4817DRAFT_332087, partial [Daldinia loculata]|uniref:uncharacterized protein n=1 Tax=Daldinia loculata TaxID=103429 RepID=UPI0020C2861A